MRRTLATLCLASAALTVAPADASAARLTFRVAPNAAPGDSATIIEARIDPESANLNVVEGALGVSGDIADGLSVEVETGGSALTVWPVAPEYSPAEKVVRFTGGVPGGFSQESPLLRLRLLSPSDGTVTVSWIGGSAYRNDGQGTPEPISAGSIAVNLASEDASDSAPASADAAPPQFASAEIGRDPNSYGGKYFVSFLATDGDSGIARYSVREGDSVTDVEGGVYVLEDQSLSTRVEITAIDRAGNRASLTVPGKNDAAKRAAAAIVVVTLAALAAIYARKKFFNQS